MDKNINEDNKNITVQKKKGKSSNSANTSRIKELREKHNLTQEEFANRLNRDFQMISHIERGTKGLYLPLAIEISKEFGVSLDWLYELSDDTKDTASNIIDSLKSVFDIDFENKTITIEPELAKFIEKLSQVYKTRNEQQVPDEAFKYWIEGIKKEYNDKMDELKGKTVISNMTRYYLQTVDEHFREKAPTSILEDFSTKR